LGTYRYGRRNGYWISVIHLIGHLVGTAVIFTAVMSLGWGVSYMAHLLHDHHRFPDQIYNSIMWFEVGLFWFDVAISSVVLLIGACRFLKEILEH